MKPVTSDLKLARALSWVIAGIMVLLPFHAFFTTWAASWLGHPDPIRIWKEVLLLLITPLTVYLAWRTVKLRITLLHTWFVRLIMLYILLHFILGAWALATDKVSIEALLYALIVNLRFIAFFLICLVVATSSDFLMRNWQKILLLPAAVVVAFGLLQKFVLPYDFLRHFGYGPGSLPAYQTVDQQLDLQRIQSTLRGANPLGAYLVVIISALLVVLRKNRVILIIGTGLAAIALYYSHSRSAWVGMVVAASILAGFRLRRRFKLVHIVLVYLAAAILAAAAVYGLRHTAMIQEAFLHDREGTGAVLNSNEARSQALRQAASEVAAEPLGRGPGTAGPASFRNDKPARIAENYYLQLAQEVGVLGLILFIAINVLITLRLWARRNENLPLVLLVSLLGISVTNLFLHTWTDDTLAYLWWGLAGIALAPVIITDRHKRNGKAQQSKTKT